MPKYAIDYQTTTIYKIVCRDINITECYVGHTTNFCKRKQQHNKDCNNETSIHYNYKVYQFIRNNGEWQNWDMIEIEKYPCNDVNEAKKRERYWIETLKATLNVKCPSRTDKEYKDTIYNGINGTRKIYNDANRDRNIAYGKQYRIDNKEEIKERRTKLIVCECGREIQIKTRWCHIKSNVI